MLQSVFLIPPERRGCLTGLYPKPNALQRACLAGEGEAWGDHPFKPGAALLLTGEFVFPGGDSKRPGARRLAGKLALQKGKTWLVPQMTGWEAHIRYWNPARMESAVSNNPDVPYPLWEITY